MNFSILDQSENIYPIYKENHISSGGQIVSDFEHPGTITYVAKIKNKIVAYVSVMEHLPERVTVETAFGNKGYRLPERALYIRQVAVLKEYQDKGIGKECYRELQKLYPNIPFYAFVDIRNTQSFKFHLRNGFFPVGVYVASKFCEALNYTALLLARC